MDAYYEDSKKANKKKLPTADEAFGPETVESLLGPRPAKTETVESLLGPRPEPKPGLVQDIKHGLGGAVKVGQDVASSLAGVPDWAVEMQERREGKPYEGLLTTPLPFLGQSIRDLSKKASEAIQTPIVSERSRQAAETVEAPLRALDKVAKTAGNVTQSVTGSPSAGVLAETAVNLAPAFLGRKGGKEIAGKVVDTASEIAKKPSERLYRSAVKPAKKLSPGESKALIDQGLKSRTLVSEGWQGVRKLERAIDRATDYIDEVIDHASKSGDDIPTYQILKNLDKIRNSYPSWRGDTAFDNMYNTIKVQGDKIPIADAQHLKRQLNHAYDQQSSSLLNEGERALRHSILDEEIKLHPELKSLGMNEKAMIDLKKAIDDRLKVYSRRDVIGLGNLLKPGLGLGAYKTLGHPVAVAVTTLAAMIGEHPKIKSAVAIALNDARKVGTKGAKGVISTMPPIPVIPGMLPQPGAKGD